MVSVNLAVFVSPLTVGNASEERPPSDISLDVKTVFIRTFFSGKPFGYKEKTEVFTCDFR